MTKDAKATEQTSDKSAGPYVPEVHPEDTGNMSASEYDWRHASATPQTGAEGK